MTNKKIISLLGLFIAFPVIVLAYFNLTNNIDFFIAKDKISLPLAYIMAFVFIEGVAAGFFMLYGFYLDVQTRMKEQTKRLEKTSISADSDSSRVAVLEAKIEVLEKALKSALDQNN